MLVFIDAQNSNLQAFNHLCLNHLKQSVLKGERIFVASKGMSRHILGVWAVTDQRLLFSCGDDRLENFLSIELNSVVEIKTNAHNLNNIEVVLERQTILVSVPARMVKRFCSFFPQHVWSCQKMLC